MLSHGIAHVIAKHAAVREEEARQVSINSDVVNDVLSDPQDGAMALARSKIKFATFSRGQEFEADGIGVGIAAKAGFDPYSASRFLTSMGRNADLRQAGGEQRPVRSPDFFSSHPATPNASRTRSTDDARAVFGAAPGGGERDRNPYLASLDGLVYGEDPIEGYVRGRRFLHPKLGFTFVAPEGFSLDNTAQAILGLKDNGNQALRLDADQGAGRAEPDRLPGLGLDRERRDRLDRGAHAGRHAGRNGGGQRRPVVVPALRRCASTARSTASSSPPRRAPRRRPTSAFSRPRSQTFRRLSQSEAQKAKPLRIKIVTVKPGDTVEKIGRAPHGADRP